MSGSAGASPARVPRQIVARTPLNRLPAAFGKLLKRLRVGLNLGQEALSVAAGFSDPSAVANMERGEREPTLTELFRIAAALRNPPAILFIEVIAVWRGDDADRSLYPSRASSFERLYRLGYHHKIGDFREHEKAYGSVAEATPTAERLNKQHHERRVKLLDTVTT